VYINECWGYDSLDVRVLEHEAAGALRMSTLRMSVGSDIISVMLTDGQLRQVELAISRYLDKRAAEQMESATAATVAS
jgi:hypothetical protein